jgi:hypothetical protein
VTAPCPCRGCTIAYAAGKADEQQRIYKAVEELSDLGERNWVDADCSCMEHYCYCEHRGKAQALAAIKGEES